jgi:hypothetical protein
MLIAFAGACLQAGAVELAADTYEQATNVAARAEAWPLAGQAWFGVGSTLQRRRQQARALNPTYHI